MSLENCWGVRGLVVTTPILKTGRKGQGTEIKDPEAQLAPRNDLDSLESSHLAARCLLSVFYVPDLSGPGGCLSESYTHNISPLAVKDRKGNFGQ